jgi:hypothetical protein
MRIRPWFVIVALLLLSASARADDHTAGIFFGYSLSTGYSTLGKGFHAAGEWALAPPGATPAAKAASRNWTLVGEFSSNWGSPDEVDVRQLTFAGGLRYAFAWEDHQKGLPFVHVLGGGVNIEEGDDSDTKPAIAIGIGFDYLFSRSNTSPGWGVRVQGDYIALPGDINPRVSVGVVKRFGRNQNP